MEKLTEDLNIIQNLPDQPTLSPQELKAKFDEAVGIIKSYLNLVVEPTVTNIESDYSTSADFKDYKQKVDNRINGFQTEIDGIDGRIESAMGVATNYEDFVIETKGIAYSVSQSTEKDITGTYTKTGYKPLGIVGHYYTSVHGGSANGAYVKTLTDTEITVQGHIARGNTGGTTSGNLYVNILWMKIKEKTVEESE